MRIARHIRRGRGLSSSASQYSIASEVSLYLGHMKASEPALTKWPKNVKTEMALCVLAYNLTGFMNILGPGPLIRAMRDSRV